MAAKALWRIATVMAKTGLPRSTIYQKMTLDEFPQSVNLGLRSVGWISDEVEQWINDRILASRQDA